MVAAVVILVVVFRVFVVTPPTIAEETPRILPHCSRLLVKGLSSVSMCRRICCCCCCYSRCCLPCVRCYNSDVRTAACHRFVVVVVAAVDVVFVVVVAAIAVLLFVLLLLLLMCWCWCHCCLVAVAVTAVVSGCRICCCCHCCCYSRCC